MEWAAERTYRRWAHYGTLYGYTYHSGTMLSGPSYEPPTCQHFKEFYFEQALLMLYIRVGLFRFSKELTSL